MNYIIQINNFWKTNLEYSFTGNETKLYFFLLHTSNSLGWKNPFRLSYRQIELGANLTTNTIKSARNKLCQAGLISYQEGKRGNARNINNKTLYQIQIAKNDTYTASPSAHHKDNLTDTQPQHINKEINIKQNINTDKNNNIQNRIQHFKNQIFQFKQTYSAEMLTQFFDYWSELNTSHTKMRFELQKTWELAKRLKTWAARVKTQNTASNFANYTNEKHYDEF